MFDKETGIFTLTFHVNVEEVGRTLTDDEVTYLLQSTQDDPYLDEVIADVMKVDVDSRRDYRDESGG